MKRYIKADESYDVMLEKYPLTKYEYTVLGTYNSLEDAKQAKDRYKSDDYNIGKIAIIHEEDGKYILYVIEPNKAKLLDSNEQQQYQHIAKAALSSMGFDTSLWDCIEVRNNYGETLLIWNTPFGKMTTSLFINTYGSEPYIKVKLSGSIGIRCDKADMKKVPVKDRDYSAWSIGSFISALDSGNYKVED